VAVHAGLLEGCGRWRTREIIHKTADKIQSELGIIPQRKREFESLRRNPRSHAPGGFLLKLSGHPPRRNSLGLAESDKVSGVDDGVAATADLVRRETPLLDPV
jgi:hypothetical protein